MPTAARMPAIAPAGGKMLPTQPHSTRRVSIPSRPTETKESQKTAMPPPASTALATPAVSSERFIVAPALIIQNTIPVTIVTARSDMDPPITSCATKVRRERPDVATALIATVSRIASHTPDQIRRASHSVIRFTDGSA